MTDEQEQADTSGPSVGYDERPPTAVLREIGIFGGLDDAVLEGFVRRLPISSLSPGSRLPPGM